MSMQALLLGLMYSEAEKFPNDGYFFSELGNCMPLAITNALGIPLIIMSSHPFISLSPRKAHVLVPLVNAFDHHGSAHYDAIEHDPVPKVKTAPTIAGCTCGKGDKTSAKHYILKQAKYTTIMRCPCLKQRKACTQKCHCRNCHNPHGQRLTINSSPLRQRRKHKWQVDIPKSMTYGMKMGEEISPGKRTVFEFEILKYCDNAITSAEQTENILAIYTATEEVARGLELSQKLRPKDEQDIEIFLKEHQHILREFKSITLAQVESTLMGAHEKRNT